MQNLRLIIIFLKLLMISSCGFTPVYRSSSNKTYDFLQKLELAPIETIEGAELYNQLKNILPPSSSAIYILEAKLRFSNDFSIIEKNSDVLREMVKLNVSYKVREKASGRIVSSGKFTRLSSYNTSFSLYANSSRNQQMLVDLAIMAAEEIRNRIILYIENNKQ